MNRIRRWLRRQSDKDGNASEMGAQSSADLYKRIADALQDSRVAEAETRVGRAPTEDEIIVAAWANLAIEEPDLSLEEARQIILERSALTPAV